jgi:uncharacterized RDD family membrane protein YckC
MLKFRQGFSRAAWATGKIRDTMGGSEARTIEDNRAAAAAATAAAAEAAAAEAAAAAPPEESSSLAATAYDPERPPLPPNATVADPLIGQRIDHFEIRAQLGQGGMGTVYLAHDLSLERPVAIKVLRRELADDPELVSRLVLEARAQARLQHPNVVNVYYIGRFEGAPYFAMEYVRGKNLSEIVQESGPLGWEQALDYVTQTTRALMEGSRRGIVHRDVKPSNLILAESNSGAPPLVRVADFGLAAPPGFKEERFVGSPYYASPEQLAGRAPDHRSDIYSLAITFHELLTGAPPFQADSLAALTKMHEQAPRPDIPERQAPWKLRRLIVEMMDADPTKRPWTYEELLGRLEALRSRPVAPGGVVARGMALAVDLTLVPLLAPLIARVLAVPPRRSHELAFIAFALYYVLAHRLSGRTLGKRLFGLRLQGTTRAVSFLGMGLRFVVEFWGPIAALVMIHLQMAGSQNATNLAAMGKRLTEIVGVQSNPVFDGTSELLQVLWVPNLVLAIPWLAGFLLAAFDENRLTFHDRVARTRVIYAIRGQDKTSGPG